MPESSPQEGIQRFYLRKFLSMVVSQEMSFSRRRWCCASSVVSPTLEDSGMSFPGQCDTLMANQTSVESEPHDELSPSVEPQDESSDLSEEIPREENCRKDQFNPKETSQQEPDKLPLNANKSMNTNQNLKKCSNLIESIPIPTTYKKWWHNSQLCRIDLTNLVSKKGYLII